VYCPAARAPLYKKTMSPGPRTLVLPGDYRKERRRNCLLSGLKVWYQAGCFGFFTKRIRDRLTESTRQTGASPVDLTDGVSFPALVSRLVVDPLPARNAPQNNGGLSVLEVSRLVVP
jgi:hypothetical protein